jgi:hypothetical protein
MPEHPEIVFKSEPNKKQKGGNTINVKNRPSTAAVKEKPKGKQ